jgi:hypothetical protein
VKRLTSLLAVTVLGASLLTACSGGSDDYCGTLKDTKAQFDSLETGDFKNFDELTDKFDEVVDQAPDEVKDDWEVLRDAVKEFVDALEDAGLKPSDLDALQKTGELPDGVTMDDVTEAFQKAQALSSDDVGKASEAIRKHAKDECNIELELGT